MTTLQLTIVTILFQHYEALFSPVLQHLTHGIVVHVGTLRGDVAARLANLRQHLTGHPTLESLSLWQLRRENQRVETALVDDDYASGLT